jgi:hypothetical protein
MGQKPMLNYHLLERLRKGLASVLSWFGFVVLIHLRVLSSVLVCNLEQCLYIYEYDRHFRTK